MEVMEAKLKGFDKLCDSLQCTPEEKIAAHDGAKVFFENGWPSSCFTVLMAISASQGNVPKRYARAVSRMQYEHKMNTPAVN